MLFPFFLVLKKNKNVLTSIKEDCVGIMKKIIEKMVKNIVTSIFRYTHLKIVYIIIVE